tara:strand:+ start:4606 stop:4923 length:318 start_codon:yes stop_codon:yes gene_type:complete
MSTQDTLNVSFTETEEEEAPRLSDVISQESELKQWLVEYVGNKLTPNDGNVTVENVVHVVAEEFPEFLMSVAEENWIRGYRQGLVDVEEGMKLAPTEEVQKDESN